MTFFTGKPSPEALSAFANRNILDLAHFSKNELETIMNTANYYEEALKAKKSLHDMDGKILAALFFEPSTRTRLSFEAAMHRLGGNVITVTESAGAQTSSLAKGETLHDSVTVINAYCDVIACRSPIQGARLEVAEAATVPVINCGDGIGQHPSQALLDIYTIIKEKGGIDGLTLALVGDLKNGRTVHSLVDALSLYDIKLILVSPPELKMPSYIYDQLTGQGIPVEETDNLLYAAKKADVLYMTRIQKERFEDAEEYEKIKDVFILTDLHVAMLPPGAIILHPLPRVNEIVTDVDSYPGAAYFRQAANGLPVRMALLALVTGSVL